MPGFLDISSEELEQLRLRVTQTESQSVLESGIGEVCVINHCLQVSQQQDVSKFHVVLCDVGNVREADTKQVFLAPDSHRLGYSFPLTALKSGVGIESPWAIKFAEVGFRKLTTLIAIDRYSIKRSFSELKNNVRYLDELYSDNYTMFVFSQEALDHKGISNTVLELMLLEREFYIVRGHETTEVQKEDIEPSNENIKLRLPCPEAQEDCYIIGELIRRGDADSIGVGAFLQYYQILEFCIDKIFENEISQLPNSQLNTWDLKSKLGKIVTEQYRICLLDSDYLSASVRRAAFVDLKNECIQFMENSDEGIKEDNSWCLWLYKVRNMIVHNQIKMHKETGDMELKAINAALRKACFELILHFSITGSATPSPPTVGKSLKEYLKLQSDNKGLGLAQLGTRLKRMFLGD